MLTHSDYLAFAAITLSITAIFSIFFFYSWTLKRKNESLEEELDEFKGIREALRNRISEYEQALSEKDTVITEFTEQTQQLLAEYKRLKEEFEEYKRIDVNGFCHVTFDTIETQIELKKNELLDHLRKTIMN